MHAGCGQFARESRSNSVRPRHQERTSGAKVIGATRDGKQLAFAPTLIDGLARDPAELRDVAD
jgi:hypothetical protein